MARLYRFSFLCNNDERRLIEKLAARMQRSQSDAVRFTVVNAARELDAQIKSDKIAAFLEQDRSPAEQDSIIQSTSGAKL